MQSATRLGSYFLLTTLLLGAARAVPLDAKRNKPIPQDLAKIEKRRSEFLEWNRRTLIEAYDKVGNKNPKWDAKAREAMELAARMFSLRADPVVTHSDIHVPARAAVEAGCDDPLIVYLFDRSAAGKDYRGPEETVRRMKMSGPRLGKSRYPAFRRLIAYQLTGTYILSDKNSTQESKKEAKKYFDSSLSLLLEAAKSDEHTEFWADRIYDTMIDLIRGYRTVGLGAESAYKRVDEALEDVPDLKALRLQVRGNFWYHYGWEARSQVFAQNVSKNGFQLFAKRTALAKKAYQEAWNTHHDARTARAFLEISKSGDGDRGEMEIWFDRAMEADGDGRSACWTKLDWLDPKWHGTPEEMLAFGQQCRDTKNWWAGLTLLCADAHLRYASKLGDKMGEYLAKPEVWSDIKSVSEEYLTHRPSDHVARSKFATMAYLAKHYHESYDQFEILGDDLTSWSEFPFYPLQTLKGFRDSMTKVKNGKPIPKKNEK